MDQCFCQAVKQMELGMTANEYEISFWNDENFPILDSGDKMYPKALNRTLESMPNFISKKTTKNSN